MFYDNLIFCWPTVSIVVPSLSRHLVNVWPTTGPCADVVTGFKVISETCRSLSRALTGGHVGRGVIEGKASGGYWSEVTWRKGAEVI